MSTGRLLTTPWTRARLSAIGYGPEELDAIRVRLPEGSNLHLSGRGPNGPWTVRLFVGGREVLPFEGREDPGYRDLGYAIEYAVSAAEGMSNGRRA